MNNYACMIKEPNQRRGRPTTAKRPELILWVIITMLLVKLAIILFGKA